MMNLSWLRTFIFIVEKKSLTKAAHALHLTQPAVSKQLNSLEKLYGISLLHRTSRYVNVTEAGKIVYDYSKQILAKVNESKVAVQALQKELSGSLVLGASTIPGEYILPAALGRFQELHPQVIAKLEIADSTEIGQLIMDAKLEAGMIGALLDNPLLCQEHIADDELVVIAASQHHLADERSIILENILEEPLIVREAGSGTQLVIESKLKEKDITPDRLNVRLELGSTAAVVNAVAAGLGISLVSRFAVKNRINSEDIAVLDIEDLPLERGLYFVTRRDQVISPLVESFYEFLKEYLQLYPSH
ncbi:MAG: selenium metabolism-associated LysR family transcriptional regulator [Syntrophaceticus sp.]|nr:selenium metabolism-associated LysR family transcriptional regulator [Syntrophaceticus sp.]MDD3314438.1 selenium metabolism-associated LysR family transcriptional regulator [Syntrophaceticus sp.]MDD4360566.1 selenium metabolism-associated LysR family transcriptional regulator [Syntrophaceticus sp.]MDD4783103.1 selenium metabolism-associated LysR family transcriptional regulator [Syntrophaceticus sp.]